jgi:uncharacterized membrane protein
MARDVIVATFETRNQAYDAAIDIDRLDDGVVDVKGGAIVEKDPLGNVMTLDSRGLDSAWGLAGAAGGALLGALVGALAGPAGVAAGAAVGGGAAAGGLMGGTTGALVDVTDWGLKVDYIDLVRSRMRPGTTALVAEVEEGSTEPIDQAVARHGGSIYRTPLNV